MITDEQIMQIFEKTDRPDLNDFTVRFARAIIEEHEQRKWIKFNQENESTYPKDEDTYIVFNGYSKQAHPAIWLTPEKQWSFDEADYLETITHWQPLPEKPKEQS